MTTTKTKSYTLELISVTTLLYLQSIYHDANVLDNDDVVTNLLGQRRRWGNNDDFEDNFNNDTHDPANIPRRSDNPDDDEEDDDVNNDIVDIADDDSKDWHKAEQPIFCRVLRDSIIQFSIGRSVGWLVDPSQSC